MTFARFMELALYHEPWGYYSSGPERIGAEGDFYTSPVAHPAFGALLTVQLAGDVGDDGKALAVPCG